MIMNLFFSIEKNPSNMPPQMRREENKQTNKKPPSLLSFAYLKVAIIHQKCELLDSGKKSFVYRNNTFPAIWQGLK